MANSKLAELSNLITAILIDSTSKTLIVFLLALLILAALAVVRRTRHSQVHTVHRLWSFLIASMLLIPILSFVLPEVSVPIAIPASENIGTSPHQETFVVALKSNRDKENGNRSNGITDFSAGQFDSGTNTEPDFQTAPNAFTGSDMRSYTPSPSSNNQVPANGGPAGRIHWQHVISITWSIVASLLLARLIGIKLWTNQLIKESKPIPLSQVVGKFKAVDQNHASFNVVESSRVSSPVVCGLISHTIILPESWQAWSPEKRSAVLAHESAHIQRRDGLVMFFAQINAAFFWFNPIAWIAKAKVGRLAELACDQTASTTTGDRVEYAQQLLEIAASKVKQNLQPGIPMAAHSGITERIEMLLDTAKPFSKKSSRVFVAALLLIGTPLLMVIAAAEPGSVDQRSGREKAASDWIREENGKTILTFRGEVVDTNGEVIPNPKIYAKCGHEPIETKITGNEFEIDFALENWHSPGLSVIASSSDGKQAGIIQFFSSEFRHQAARFHQIRLQPTRAVKFKVTDEGEPASAINVRARSGDGYLDQGVTNNDGIAELNFPLKSVLDDVLVWSEGKIGGYSFDREPIRDPHLAIQEVELSACVDQKIRLVDSTTGKPLVGFKFESYVATKPGYNFLPRYGMQEFVTDEIGEVIDPLFPDWQSVHFYADLAKEFEHDLGWSKSGDSNSKLIDGVFVQEFEQPESLKRLPFQGKLLLPEGVKGGLEVRLTSYQHPQEGRYDPVTTRTDIDGNFSALVIPGATYSIAVNDSIIASEAWVGILAGPGSEKVDPPMIKVFEGEPISVKLTVGPNQKPIPNQVVAFSSEYSFEWKENGNTKSGSDSLQWWAVTNEEGIATTTAAPGNFESHIYNPDWRPSQTFTVEKGVPTNITFHRKSTGKRLIRGKLSAPAGTKIDFAGTLIDLRAMDGETMAEEAVTADGDGNFTVEMDGARIGGFAKTADGKFATMFFTGEPDKGITATLNPTITYRGKFIDGEDQPLKDRQVKLRVIMKEKDPDWSKTNFVSTQFDVDTLLTDTNDEGEFEFIAPANTPLRLSILNRVPSERDDGFKSAGEKFLIPGEERPAEVMRIGAKATRESTAEETVAWKVLDCQLSRTRELTVLEGDGDSVNKFLQRALNDDEDENRFLYWYTVTRISSSELENPTTREYWEKHHTLPGDDQVAMIVLDHDAKPIDRILLNTKTAELEESLEKASKFITKNKIKDVDANGTLKNALTLAKETDRKVWLQFSQTRCGPCFLLSRWINKQKELLEKSYVIIKVDNVRDENGQEIWKRYVGNRSMGIPFTVILDQDGKLIEESTDRLKSNVGFPTTFEDKRVFRRIFEATAKQLSKTERKSLVESIGK